QGQILHFDGTSWSPATGSGTGADPFDRDLRYEGIWGAAPNDVWAGAVHVTQAPPMKQALPVFSHFDGAHWRVVAAPADICDDPKPTIYNTTSWSGANGKYDARRPFGPLMGGTDAGNILFQADSVCAWRYDGTRWVAEPGAYFRQDDGLHGVFRADAY